MASVITASPLTSKQTNSQSTPNTSSASSPIKKLTKSQLDKMKKDDVVNLLRQTEQERDKFRAERDTLLQQLNTISTQYQQVEKENKGLRDDMNQLRDEFTTFKQELTDKKVKDRITELERKLYANEQYGRRECVEIYGFKDIENENVEAEAIKLLNKIGVDVSSQEFHATHKLKNQNVIIMKAVNRKTTSKILKNKHKLKDLRPNEDLRVNAKEVYINESLCPYYRKLLGKCNALFKLGKLSSFYTINGTVTIKVNPTDNEPMTITHSNDLIEIFGKDQMDSLDKRKQQK